MYFPETSIARDFSQQIKNKEKRKYNLSLSWPKRCVKMIENILWLAVGLMVTSSAVPRTLRIRKLVGGIGWCTFSIYWSYQPFHYLKVLDYVNVLLSIVVTLFCIFVAFIMFHEYREGPLRVLNNGDILHSKFSTLDIVDFRNVTSMLTSACALGALVYFPFANFTYLNTWIIGGVTSQVVCILQYLDIPAYMKDWNMITLNGHTVEIILACTAIESIALFMGLIGAVRAPLSRLITAFTVSGTYDLCMQSYKGYFCGSGLWGAMVWC